MNRPLTIVRPMLTTTAASCLLTLGCGDDSESTDIATARSSWSELSQALDGNIAQYEGAGDGGVKVDFNCQGGGAASVDGNALVQAVPVRVEVEADVRYAQCVTARGTKLDGAVHFAQHVAVGGGDTVRVETVYTGEVAFSGTTNANCAVDMHVLVDVDGKLVSVTGSFCGHPAEQLDVAITPHWRS